jgi:fructokinase
MERKIFGIGEVVYDIIFKNNIPIDARPGGAILNALISLSRLGLNPYLIADFVNDTVGKILLEFIEKNKVYTEYLNWYESGRSRLALAFLNNQNDADYLFYKMQSEDNIKLNFPKMSKDDIVLFGSYYGIKPEIRNCLNEFLKRASDCQSIIVYDPNFRKPHLSMLEKVRPFIFENFNISDIVKGSIEDFNFIYNTDNPNDIFSLFKQNGGKNLIITSAGKDVYFFNHNFSFHLPVPNIIPISTIGAGDSFSAAIVFSIVKMDIFKNNIDSITQTEWKQIVNFAIECAINVCQSYENYYSSNSLKNNKM